MLVVADFVDDCLARRRVGRYICGGMCCGSGVIVW